MNDHFEFLWNHRVVIESRSEAERSFGGELRSCLRLFSYLHPVQVARYGFCPTKAEFLVPSYTRITTLLVSSYSPMGGN